MKINYQYEAEAQRFSAYDDTKLIGKIEYKSNNQTWEVYHTEVDPLYQGLKIARTLVNLLIEEATKQNITIIPTCEYVKKVLKK